MRDVDSPLGFRPRRVIVAGVSGAGKTTLAGRIADALGSRHVEIDGLFHGAGWVPRPEFEADVEAFVAEDEWVTEWQYRSVRELLVSRADVMVWLDLPYWTSTLPRLVARTLRRRLRREVLWNGNVEPALWTVFTDPEHILRWSFSTRHKYRERVPQLARDEPGLVVVRLRSRAEVERWLAGPLADVGCRRA
ncbi:AAA family ATPase [Aestuariimicrobium sp. Y1814]|uniref:AAA family ATPase n=1 Tax=Aestuariimicrobium sp. Y1814 TaxID=3418742 RepID=UPI003DA6E293